MERYNFDDYRKIVAKLRSPQGCPWDKSQTHDSLRNCLMNETAEVLAAIDVWKETDDSGNLCEELGDLLLQIMLHSQIAEEEGLFTIEDVIQAAGEKMVRRHPHVFGGQTWQPDWEEIKRLEKEKIPAKIQEVKTASLKKVKVEIRDHFSE